KAITCQSIDIMKQLLEIGTTFIHEHLAIVCRQKDMEFILDALDLYHRQKGCMESYWIDPLSPSSASDPSFNGARQTSVCDQSTASQCELDPTGQSRLGSLIIASTLAL